MFRAPHNDPMTGDDVGAEAQLHWTEVDGVPVVWAEDRGPLRASLMFRVGKADEQLPTNGITHLVEHLALYRLGQQPHYQNGSVRTSITSFESVGESDEVATFLAGVCEGLTDLPTDRREAELRVLETELSRRANSTFTAALTWRYGPAGPGLWTYDEFAGVTSDDAVLQSWADRMFCRENAVLVLTGPPPAGLRLPLRDGERHSPPPLVDVLAHNPAWFQHGFGDVAALTPLGRSAAAVAYTYALQHRLVDQLRFELGVAYSPSVDYDAYDGRTALVFARTDAHADHLQAVTDVLVASIDHIADHGPDPQRVDEHRARTAARYASDDAASGLAYYVAMDTLLKGERTSVAELTAELAALTYDDVTAAAVDARRRMIYAVPTVASMSEERAWRVPEWSTEAPVRGQEIRPVGSNQGRLTLGPDGLTHDLGSNRVATVRYATCRAVLAWPDGRRLLISPEAVSIDVEPSLWQDGRTVVASIDRNTSSRQIRRPARDEEAIAKPVDARPAIIRKSLRSGQLLIAIGIAVVVMGVVAALLPATRGIAPNPLVGVVAGVWLTRWGVSMRRDALDYRRSLE